MAATTSRLSLALAGTLLLAHPALARQERLDGDTLRMATWGGGWVERVQKTIQPQLAARGQKPPFDVTELSETDTDKPIRQWNRMVLCRPA